MTDLSPSLLARAFDAHPGAQLLVAVDTGRVRGANRAAATLVGCSPARMTGRPLDEIVPAGDTRGAGSLLARLQPENGASPGPALVVEVSGRPLELGAVPVGDDDGTPLLLVTLQDVTERVHTERRLRDYHEILEDVPVPFYRASPGEDSHFLRVNPALVDLFDADSPEELHAHPITDLYADPADRDEFLETLARDGRVFRCELRMRTLRGRTIWTADSAFRHLDEEGRPVIDGILEDITRRRELEQELSYQARFDALTDLANRREGETVLHTEIARATRYAQPLSALMIDIDHFKRINDRFGHAGGDRVLQRIAEVIRARVRRTDLAARWGGEEFLVILPATAQPEARQLAEALRDQAADLALPDDGGVTISAGYASYQPGEGDERFLQRLDRALYLAKHRGRDRVAAAEEGDAA